MEALSGAATESSNDADGEALPPVETTRWITWRKAAVVKAAAEGRLGQVEACKRYGISDVDLRLWERAIACAGVPGLRVTRVQIYCPIFEAKAGQ